MLNTYSLQLNRKQLPINQPFNVCLQHCSQMKYRNSFETHKLISLENDFQEIAKRFNYNLPVVGESTNLYNDDGHSIFVYWLQTTLISHTSTFLCFWFLRWSFVYISMALKCINSVPKKINIELVRAFNVFNWIHSFIQRLFKQIFFEWKMFEIQPIPTKEWSLKMKCFANDAKYNYYK